MDEGVFRPQQFGKYLLTDRIGAGGMAEIFRATAFGVEGFTKEICIKRILPTLTSDTTFVKMFIDEAKIAVSLHHANVVQVFDLGRIGEHYFIAMELVRGRDLLQIINACRAQKRRLPVHIALYILGEVCKGLDYAHRVKSEGRPLGIIHRDVSPSNILVSWEGDVKVADFGIAKATHTEHKTATGTMKGKYGYMSPEQVKGERIDHRSDIFAAGILLYECLAARRLFKGETDLETLEQVREARVPQPPSAVNKKASPEIDALVMRALSLDPAERFASAGEMHDAIADQLFATGKRVDSKLLAAFMQKLFRDEIEREEERDSQRRKLQDGTPAPSESEPAGAGPSGAPPAGPATRPDLPSGLTPAPRTARSSLRLALLGTGVILLLAAAVVLGVWWMYEPEPRPVPRPEPAGPAEPEPAPEPKRGALEISSQPKGASIWLDGRDTGRTTPATLDKLGRAQPHRVELRLNGRVDWSQDVEFGDAERMAIRAELAPAAVPRPEPRPRPRPKPKPVRPPRPAKGVLNVNAVGAWAYVYVDGQKQDRPTPLYGLKLPAGRHRIELVNPKLDLRQVRTVHIRKGQTTNLVVELEPGG